VWIRVVVKDGFHTQLYKNGLTPIDHEFLGLYVLANGCVRISGHRRLIALSKRRGHGKTDTMHAGMSPMHGLSGPCRYSCFGTSRNEFDKRRKKERVTSKKTKEKQEQVISERFF